MRVHVGTPGEKNVGAPWPNPCDRDCRSSRVHIYNRRTHHKSSTIKIRILFPLASRQCPFRGNSIVAFIDSVRRRIGRPLMVIRDQIPIHQSFSVERYLSQHEDVLVELFPPYAPELNPVDYVWAYVKYGRLANYCPDNLDQLRRKVTSELSRIKTRPDLLRSFFHATGLEL